MSATPNPIPPSLDALLPPGIYFLVSTFPMQQQEERAPFSFSTAGLCGGDCCRQIRWYQRARIIHDVMEEADAHLRRSNLVDPRTLGVLLRIVHWRNPQQDEHHHAVLAGPIALHDEQKYYMYRHWLLEDQGTGGHVLKVSFHGPNHQANKKEFEE